jgi:hypothetical protein
LAQSSSVTSGFMAASPGVLKSSPKHLPAARVPNHSFFPIALKESIVEHELRNRWKRSHFGKLELNRIPLS